jgi:8-oxo-dGTP pyrophosphatase MutT (NUDIX family)
MSEQNSHGVIDHENNIRKTDYLYRVSMKSLIRNEKNEILVVKETGRDWWDLPGGGMDHGEDIKSAIAREMKEEVNLYGNFSYKVIDIDNPHHLAHSNIWQVRIIFEVTPLNMIFEPGEDGDEVAFMNPELFKDSNSDIERRVYEYATKKY